MNQLENPLVLVLLLLLVGAVLALAHWLTEGLAGSSNLATGWRPSKGYPKRIIVPLLDRATWRDAVDVACDLAAEHRATILLVHVIEIPWTLGLDVPLPEVEEEARSLLEAGRTVVAGRGLQVEARILRHRAATEAIVGLARETGADAIVMESGTPPWWSLARIERTVSGLLRRASCQVIVVKAPRAA